MSLRLENSKEWHSDLPILEDSSSCISENTPQIEDPKELFQNMEKFIKNDKASLSIQESYEVPSRALYNAVLLSKLSEESQASTSASTISKSPRNNRQLLQDICKIKLKKTKNNNFDVPLTDEMTFSTISVPTINSLKTIFPSPSKINILDKREDNEKVLNTNESLKFSKLELFFLELS